MTVTITHDPDDPRGCIACPLFHGVPRDGGCRALDGPGMHTLHHRIGGTFEPAADCPLRHGGVHVRAPEPAADHHEPAEGDAVRVEADGCAKRRDCDRYRAHAIRRGETLDRVREALDDRSPAAASDTTLQGRASRIVADLGTARSALGSIAITLDMHTDALPGAIVERVEMVVRDLATAREHLQDLDRSEAVLQAIESALGDACTGDLAADVWRVRTERARLHETVSVFGMSDGLAIRALTDARARIAELERGIDRGDESAEVARLRERIGYYENGHYDALVHDLRTRLGLPSDAPGSVLVSAEDAAAVREAWRGLEREHETLRGAPLAGEMSAMVEAMSAAGWPLASERSE